MNMMRMQSYTKPKIAHFCVIHELPIVAKHANPVSLRQAKPFPSGKRCFQRPQLNLVIHLVTSRSWCSSASTGEHQLSMKICFWPSTSVISTEWWSSSFVIDLWRVMFLSLLGWYCCWTLTNLNNSFSSASAAPQIPRSAFWARRIRHECPGESNGWWWFGWWMWSIWLIGMSRQF